MVLDKAKIEEFKASLADGPVRIVTTWSNVERSPSPKSYVRVFRGNKNISALVARTFGYECDYRGILIDGWGMDPRDDLGTTIAGACGYRMDEAHKVYVLGDRRRDEGLSEEKVMR